MKQTLSKIIGAGIIVAAVSADAISKEEAVGAAGLERDGITLSSPDQPYAVDALKYGARTFTKDTIDAAVAALGTTNKATLLLRPGIWMINANADWSAYVNITFKMAPGAVISHETYSVKIPNPDAGWHPWLSGTGTGLELSTQLVSSVVGGFIQINGRSAFPATITGGKGEVRLI